MKISKDKLLEMLKKMLSIRYFELACEELHKDKRIPGGAHLYQGQEASAVGVCSALERKDYVFSNHRGHGHCIAKGLDLKKMMAELEGKVTGYCRGRGGSMHIMDLDKRLMGTSGIVGGSIPLVNGPALKSKLEGTKEISVVFFGDGASNQGSFHEALNLASIWKLPSIFVLENNCYAESTPVEYACNIKNLADRSKSYGILGINADGMDVLDVYEKMLKAVKRARSGSGPTLLVVDTYRYSGHYTGDPEGYRTDKEIEDYKKRDSIVRFKRYLIDNGFLSAKEYDEIDRKQKENVEEAIAFADSSPLPDISELCKDVYV